MLKLFLFFLVFSSQVFATSLQQTQPWLGVAVDEKSPGGILIKAVLEKTPAEKAGLQVDDLITGVDETKVKTRKELMETLRIKGVGHSVQVQFQRKGKSETRLLKLEALPDTMDLMRRQLLGKPAPEFSIVKVADGKPIKNLDLMGKVTILEFWATWCSACRSAIPRLNQWAKSHKNIAIIGVSDEKEDVIKNFLKIEPMNYTVAMDAQGKIQTDYQIASIPAFILIDQKGIVRELTLGAGDYLEGLIDQAEKLASQP